MDYHFYTPQDEHLFNRRIVQISGGVDSNLAHKTNKQILALEAADDKKPIYLFINSPGGEINSGFSIYDVARFVKPKVYTVVVGLAASMGSLIALCADEDARLAFPNSKFLIHQPLISGVLQGQATDIAIHAKDIVKVKEKINKIYSEATGKPIEEIKKATDRDFWMNAQEAKEFGLISNIITGWDELK